MKKERKKQFKIYILIGVLVVLFLCMKILLLEPASKRYESLETAFKYHYGDDSEVMLILDGKESSYVVGDDGSMHTAITFSKGNNYWKDITYPNKLTTYSLSNLRYDINLSKYDEDDCYVAVMVRRMDDAVVYDSCGSEYITLPMNEESDGLYTVGFYAYIEDFDADYWINVGDSQITLDEMRKIW